MKSLPTLKAILSLPAAKMPDEAPPSRWAIKTTLAAQKYPFTEIKDSQPCLLCPSLRLLFLYNGQKALWEAVSSDYGTKLPVDSLEGLEAILRRSEGLALARAKKLAIKSTFITEFP